MPNLIYFNYKKKKIPGLFAAGDCRYESVHQVVTATGEGAAAAVAIRNYLK